MTEIFLGFYLDNFLENRDNLYPYLFLYHNSQTYLFSVLYFYSKNQTNKGAGKRSLVFEDKRSVGIFSNKAAESDAYIIQAVLFDEFQPCQGKYFSS